MHLVQVCLRDHSLEVLKMAPSMQYQMSTLQLSGGISLSIAAVQGEECRGEEAALLQSPCNGELFSQPVVMEHRSRYLHAERGLVLRRVKAWKKGCTIFLFNACMCRGLCSFSFTGKGPREHRESEGRTLHQNHEGKYLVMESTDTHYV